MKIMELLNILNSKIKQLQGKKVDMNEFHFEIGNIVNPIIKEYNLAKDFWRIHHKNNEIFELILDLKEDKRCKYKRQGEIIEVKYICKDENLLQLDILDIDKYFYKERLIKSIENNNEYIKQLEQSLLDAKTRQLEMKKELSNLH